MKVQIKEDGIHIVTENENEHRAVKHITRQLSVLCGTGGFSTILHIDMHVTKKKEDDIDWEDIKARTTGNKKYKRFCVDFSDAETSINEKGYFILSKPNGLLRAGFYKAKIANEWMVIYCDGYDGYENLRDRVIPASGIQEIGERIELP